MRAQAGGFRKKQFFNARASFKLSMWPVIRSRVHLHCPQFGLGVRLLSAPARTRQPATLQRRHCSRHKSLRTASPGRPARAIRHVLVAPPLNGGRSCADRSVCNRLDIMSGDIPSLVRPPTLVFPIARLKACVPGCRFRLQGAPTARQKTRSAVADRHGFVDSGATCRYASRGNLHLTPPPRGH